MRIKTHFPPTRCSCHLLRLHSKWQRSGSSTDDCCRSDTPAAFLCFSSSNLLEHAILRRCFQIADCSWLLKIYAKSFQQALRQITPGTSGQTQTKRVEREWDGDRKHICQGSKALTSLHKSTRLTLPSLATHFPVTQSDQWMRRPNRWTDIIPPHPPPLLNHEVITVKQQDA